jgi:hypothetical protein
MAARGWFRDDPLGEHAGWDDTVRLEAQLPPAGSIRDGGWHARTAPVDVPADFAAPAPSAAGEPANVPAAGSSPGPPHPPSDGPGDLKPPWTARELDDWLDDLVARGWFRAGPAIDAFYAAREVTFG